MTRHHEESWPSLHQLIVQLILKVKKEHRVEALLLPLAAISPPSLNLYPPIYMVSFLLSRTDSDNSRGNFFVGH